MGTTITEPTNVSLLIDRNLEQDRADAPALIGEHATVSYADLAGLVARGT